MRRAVLILCAAGTLAAPVARGAPAPGGSAPGVPSGPVARFSVVDEMAPSEIAEATRIFIDGRLVAAFRLRRGGPMRETVSVPVDDPLRPHSYALCGTVTIAAAGGAPATHEVDDTGLVADVAGRVYQALGTADFTFFYLADASPGRIPSFPSRRPSPLCHPPLS